MENILANQVISEVSHPQTLETPVSENMTVSSSTDSSTPKSENRFRYKRHRFKPNIRRQIQNLHKVDNWNGLLMVLEDWLYIICAAGVSLWTWKNLSFFIALPVYLLAVAVIGCRQKGLRLVNHAGSHKTLAKNLKLNYLLSTVMGAWLVLESFSGYNDTHNSFQNGHHPNLGTDLDVDHMAIVAQGLYGEGKTADRLRKYLLTIPTRTPRYIVFLLRNRVWNPRENKKERTARVIYLAILTGIIFYMGWTSAIILYWIVPLFTIAIWVGLFIQLAEHYPLIEMNYSIDIYVSRNRILNPIANIFIGTHHESYHLIHHLFPGLPFWQMKQAHHILMEDETYASLHQEVGWKALIKQMTPVS